MSEEKIFSISQINQAIGLALAETFPDAFWVTGEIQGYDRDAFKAGTRRWGQVYFELIEKEAGADAARASIKALMWGDARGKIEAKLKGASEKLRLQDGIQVKLLCQVDFYWPRAGLQLKVLDVDAHFTLGDMERARLALIQKLKESGLYDKNRAVPLPLVPLGVGLVTSEGTAAYHDFVDELRRSGYAFRVFLRDARMQGEATEPGVVRALAALEAEPGVDVIALVRGGGSRSDLIWFDKENIALAVARCQKPVVTGIGHEIDLSVADMVAFESRKTPTAAAQFFVEKVRVFEEDVGRAAEGLGRAVAELLTDRKRGLVEAVRLWRGASTLWVTRSQAFLSGAAQGMALNARRHLGLRRQNLALAPKQAALGAKACLTRARERLASFQRECALKDPRRVLERGYSLLRAGGHLVTSIQDVSPGQELEAQVKDGTISTKVLGGHS